MPAGQCVVFQVPGTTLNPLLRLFFLSFSLLLHFRLESPDCGVSGSPGSQVARWGRSPARPRPVCPQRPLPARPAARLPASPRRLLRSAFSCEPGRRRRSTFGSRAALEAHSSARPPPTAEPLQP